MLPKKQEGEEERGQKGESEKDRTGAKGQWWEVKDQRLVLGGWKRRKFSFIYSHIWDV